MSGISYTMPRFQAIDQNGRPMVGSTLYTYQNKTTTPHPTWKDREQTAYNTNPIVLDARGEAVIWLDPEQVYTFVLRDWFGALVWSQDDVAGGASQIDLAAPEGAQMVGFLQAGDGAVSRTMLDKARERISVLDFGAKGDGITDDSSAIQKAVNAAISEGIFNLHIPAGTYLISSPITLTSGLTITGDGGYYPRYGFSDSIFRRLKTQIVCVPEFLQDDPILDGRACHNLGLYNIEIKGNGDNVGLALGTFGRPNNPSGHYSNFNIEHCSFVQNKYGVAAKQATYNKYFRNNVSANTVAGLYLHDFCGDSEIVEQYVNSNAPDTDTSDRRTPAGIYLGVNCGNTNVVGGKIEHNAIGMYILSPGIVINGVQFDDNRYAHISATTGGSIACTFTAVGCRFLGGGYKTAVGYTGAHIWLESSSTSTRFPLNATFNGCIFKTAPKGIAVEYSHAEVISEIGPKRLVHAAGVGIIRLNFSGCDVDQSWTDDSIFFSSAAHAKSYVSLIGNSGYGIFVNNNAPLVFAPIDQRKIAYGGTAPSKGSWHSGDMHFASPIDRGRLLGSYCSKPGTFATLTGVTGSTISGSNVATLSDTSLLVVGDVILFTGSSWPSIIKYIDHHNKTVVFSANVNETLNNVPVSHPIPEFLSFSQVSARTRTSSPVGAATPNYVGEEILDTNADVWYKSVGLANTDWVALN